MAIKNGISELNTKDFKVIDFLLENEENYYASTLLAQTLYLKQEEIKKTLQKLSAYELVIYHESFTHRLYQINKNSEEYKALKQLHNKFKN